MSLNPKPQAEVSCQGFLQAQDSRDEVPAQLKGFEASGYLEVHG